MSEIQYSFPGIPLKEFRQLTDEAIFDLMRNGGILHFIDSKSRKYSSLRYENGEWIYKTTSMGKDGQLSCKNLFDWVFMGLLAGSVLPGGEDFNVTIEVQK